MPLAKKGIKKRVDDTFLGKNGKKEKKPQKGQALNTVINRIKHMIIELASVKRT